MTSERAADFDKMVFRKTNVHTGRHIAVTPENSAMRHLSYGRIILNPSKAAVSFSNGDRETALICVAGNGVVKTNGKEFASGQYDAIYIPRDSLIEVATNILCAAACNMAPQRIEDSQVIDVFTACREDYIT